MSYPLEVELNLAFLRSHCIWHVLSTNPPVRSCRDAAKRRKRLGDVGIPLFDELKTNLGVCDSVSGRRYVAAHCRGHQHLDEEKLAAVLGCRFQRLAEGELSAVFSAEKGLLNPFGLARHTGIQQVFDETVFRPYFQPNTMMTNLGDLCYGVEFRVADIVAVLDNALVADIVEEQGRRVPTEHRFGILTGNGPESGMLLWQWINARIRKHPIVFRGDISFPAVYVESVPGMGLSMELAERETVVRPVVLGGVRRLCECGATVVGIACNTSQYFADEVAEVCKEYGAEFVKTAEETARYLRREGIGTFDFFGIGAVTDFDKWSGFGSALAGFDVKIPSERNRSKISDLAYKVKKEVVTVKTLNLLRDVINDTTQTEVVVLALTELSIVVANQKKTQKSGKRFVDTLEILAERMAGIYINAYVEVLENNGSAQENDD